MASTSARPSRCRWVRSATVALPRRYLRDGEAVLAEVRAHWVAFLAPGTALVGAVAGSVWASLSLDGPVRDVGVSGGVLGLLAALVWLGFRYARWSTTALVVTNRRLVSRRSMRASRSRQIDLTSVESVTVERGRGLKLVGAGYVLVGADRPGPDVCEAFGPLPRPHDVVALIRQACDVVRAYRHPDNGHPETGYPETGHPETGQPSPLDHLERLEDLRRRGVITRAEFEAKKAQLLDRL